MESIRGGKPAVWDLLLARSDLDVALQTPHTALTALHVACQTGRVGAVRSIIESRAPLDSGVVNAADGLGYTPLMYALK